MRDSEAQLRALGDNLPEAAIFRFRQAASGPAQFEFVSAGVEYLTGVSAAEVLANSSAWFDAILPEDRALLRPLAGVQGGDQGGELLRLEVEVRMRHRATGNTRWSLVRAKPDRRDDGSIIWDGVQLDITERMKTGQELRNLKTAIQYAAEGVVITDGQGTIQYCNSAFEKMTGYTAAELVGNTPRILRSGQHEPAFYTRLWGTLRAGRVWAGQFINRRKDGSRYSEDATISPIYGKNGEISGYVAIKRDATDRLNLEDQLRRAQMLQSLGRLTAGIAHDFNNILTVIGGYSDMLLRDLREDDPGRMFVAEIRAAGEHASMLTRQLLTFSRTQTCEPRPVALNRLIGEMLKMLERLVGEDVEIVTRLDPGLGSVIADPGQLRQVLLNLLANARDAIPGRGTITIETRNLQVDRCDGPKFREVATGAYCELAVRDTGSGIDPAIQDRIFDPFFTTKSVGEGTGLGLATVYGIVRQCGGSISLESEPGRGATFRILLPHAGIGALAEATSAAEPAAPRGDETVLLVDDQEQVRHMTAAMLESCGYRVLAARTAEEALEIAARHPEPIHVLLTDVIMPRMTGKELAECLASLQPEAKVIYLSGHTADVIARRGGLEPGTHFVGKPYGLAQLAAKVRAVLGEPEVRAKRPDRD